MPACDRREMANGGMGIGFIPSRGACLLELHHSGREISKI